jgi:hypothetical protein
MKPWRLYLLITAFLSVFLYGCSNTGQKDAVAIIDGKYVITVDEFLYRYERAVKNSPEGQRPKIENYEDAEAFLGRIITGRLLEIEAEKRGYDDEVLRKSVSDFSDNLLRDKLREDVTGEICIGETDVLRFYRALGELRSVRVIFSEDAAVVKTAKKELDFGVPFAEAASVYNDDPGLRSNGGDIGAPVIYDGGFFARRVFSIEDEGGFTGVIYSPEDGGYLIIQLTEREPNDAASLPEFASIKTEIWGELLDIETEKRLNELLDNRMENAEVVYNEEVYEAVFSLSQRDLRERFSRKGVVVCAADGEPVYFDEWFEGVGPQTGMGDRALDDFKRMQPSGFKELMDKRLNLFVRAALALAEAKERGLDRRRDFVRLVGDYRAELLIDRLNDEVIGRTVPLPNEGERRRYFDTNSPEFTTHEKISGFYVLTDDEEIASTCYDRVVVGEDIVKAASGLDVSKDGTQTGFFDIYGNPSAGRSQPPVTSDSGRILKEYVFDFASGPLSPVINLGDGRFLFFANFVYTPYSEPDIDDLRVITRINEKLLEEKSVDPSVERKYKLWFEEIRDQHDIDVYERGLKNALKEIAEKSI